jgi:hypothetical protein
MVDDDISECDCEGLRGDFTALKITYQERHGLAYDDFVMALKRRLKPILKVLFRYFDLQKKRVGYVSNYRGIAILSTVGKLFELLVYRSHVRGPEGSAGGLSTRLC